MEVVDICKVFIIVAVTMGPRHPPANLIQSFLLSRVMRFFILKRVLVVKVVQPCHEINLRMTALDYAVK